MSSSSDCNPAQLRIRLKHPREDLKTEEEEEEVDHTVELDDDFNYENASKKEATMEELVSSWSSTSFKGLPSWSLTRRKRGRTPSTAGGDDDDDDNDNNSSYEDRNHLDHRPLLLLPPPDQPESTSDNDDMSTTINVDPRPGNEAHQSVDIPPPNGDAAAGASGTAAEGVHACKHCSSSFSTHQALGGHMTSHRKDNPSTAAAEQVGSDEGSNIAQDGADPNKPHKCRICNNKYETGQKLGGHMRKHYTGILSSSKGAKRRRSPPPDHDHDHGHGSSSATATSEAPPDDSNSSPPSVKNVKASLLPEDTNTKRTDPTVAASSNSSSSSAAAASASSTKEKAPHRYFDLNELPSEEGDQSSEETPASTESTLDLTLSLSISFGLR